MIIVDPVVLGDAACTRASPKWVFDRTGTLVEVPANTLGVTYDPSDLSKAPYALVEAEATNSIRNNTMQGAYIGSGVDAIPTGWTSSSISGVGLQLEVTGVGKEAGIDYVDVRVSGTPSQNTGSSIDFSVSNHIAALADQVWAESCYLKLAAGSVGANFALALSMSERSSAGAQLAFTNGPVINLGSGPLASARYSFSGVIQNGDTRFVVPRLRFSVYGGQPVDFTLRIGLPQLQRDQVDSPIKTTSGAATRAADVIGPTAGLIYSNVPAVETPYSATATYAKDAAVYDPATKIVYWSMVAGNVGKPLSDPNFWNKRTAANRWAMFDDRNSTQTSNPEEIIAVVSAKAITQGMFAGALDASEVRISMTHPIRGLVYSEVRNLVLPRSGSSFYGWGFNRLRLRTWFLTLKLPVFANALVTITILKPGGVPKCGMCMLGPTIDVGLSLMGLSTELKDYSTTTFFPDGSSDTVQRGFSKRMSVDLSVERDQVEAIEDDLIKRRQKTLVWLGSTLRGDTMLVGKFSSFRKVIDSYPRSKMALQIEGVLSQ